MHYCVWYVDMELSEAEVLTYKDTEVLGGVAFDDVSFIIIDSGYEFLVLSYAITRENML